MAMTMREVIEWLRDVEIMASTVYTATADSGGASAPLRALLKRLAADEDRHCDLIGIAAELILTRENVPVPAICVDAHVQANVEIPLRSLQDKCRAGHLTERDILEAVIQSETSEWNDIFLYVVNFCLNTSPSFQHTAAIIQAHEKRVEHYVQSLPADQYAGLSWPGLPSIWQEKILVVDDDPAVRNVWVRVLGRYGHVTTAENGEVALRVTGQEFFDIVVTDVDMPVLDGLSFLRQSIERNAHFRGRFIICTGNVTQTVTAVAREYGVPVLMKPVTIQSMRAAVERMLAEVGG